MGEANQFAHAADRHHCYRLQLTLPAVTDLSFSAKASNLNPIAKWWAAGSHLSSHGRCYDRDKASLRLTGFRWYSDVRVIPAGSPSLPRCRPLPSKDRVTKSLGTLAHQKGRRLKKEGGNLPRGIPPAR